MKLTMICPECEAMFDQGLVAEVGGESEDSIDVCEFEGQEYTCQTCGHKVKIKYVVAEDERGCHYN